MGHLSLEELHAKLDAAANKIRVGSKYKHYKGNMYTVTGLALLESTDEVAVLYSGDYDPGITFVRTLDVWDDIVEWQGKTVPRFSPLV